MNRLVIVTGLSGSGKSTALNALEDLDYFAIDNLPIKLLETFIELASKGESRISRIAIVMDLRDKDFLSQYPSVLSRVLDKYRGVEILFLDSSDEQLIKRFSETRRKHPLSKESVIEGIDKEREALDELKGMATSIVDTSDLNVHDLKKRLTESYASLESSGMQIRLISFGYKHGTPKNCDLILDVRFLNNPHFVSELREFTGLDSAVQDYINQDERADEFYKKTLDYLQFLIPNYAQEGKRYLTIGIGCTGGKHRSVYMADKLYKALSQSLSTPYAVSIEHQDLDLN